MRIKWKQTIGLVIAIIVVSIYGYFGVEHEEKLDLDDCGYAVVKDKFIEIHSSCALTVKVSDFPRVEEDGNDLILYIPEGWNLDVINKEN